MSTSQSAPISHSVPEENSQPSTTSELQSTHAGNISTSSHKPDVVIVNDDDSNEDKQLKKGKSEAWTQFDKVRIDGLIKVMCKYCKAKLRGDSAAGTSHLNSHYKTKHHNRG